MKKYLSLLGVIVVLTSANCEAANPLAKLTDGVAKVFNRAKVRFVFPAYPQKSEAHLKAAQTSLDKYGVTATFNPKNVDTQQAPPYAHTHDVRTQDFIDAMEGPEPALWAFAGGEGSVEVLARLRHRKYARPAKFKPFIGFSDTTEFHALYNHWQWPSLHAPVAGLSEETDPVTKMGINKRTSLREVADILTGKLSVLKHSFDVISRPAGASGAVGAAGTSENETEIKSSVIGGNAMILSQLKGRPIAIQGKDRFVFIEDAKPNPAELSRELVSLQQAGLFDGAKALLFGEVLAIDEKQRHAKTVETLGLFTQQHLKPFGIDIPVLYSPNFGHFDVNNVMPFGTNATLTLGKGPKATLSVSVKEFWVGESDQSGGNGGKKQSNASGTAAAD